MGLRVVDGSPDRIAISLRVMGSTTVSIDFDINS
jgi:hypothetical protein